tara:strand:+ start:301 stop:711 length:411 start_codon:yes stop_codon:yes gene_type:complete
MVVLSFTSQLHNCLAFFIFSVAQSRNISHTYFIEKWNFLTHLMELRMRRLHPIDSLVIKLLGKQGLIKREALKYLNDKVYRLTPEEVELAMQEASRAGQKAKEAYIEQLIERKRETFFAELSHQLNQPLSHQDKSA